MEEGIAAYYHAKPEREDLARLEGNVPRFREAGKSIPSYYFEDMISLRERIANVENRASDERMAMFTSCQAEDSQLEADQQCEREALDRLVKKAFESGQLPQETLAAPDTASDVFQGASEHPGRVPCGHPQSLWWHCLSEAELAVFRKCGTPEQVRLAACHDQVKSDRLSRDMGRGRELTR